MPTSSFATLTILVLTALVTWRAFVVPALFEQLLFRPERILRDKEYYRLFSSALVHGDWVHFLFNGITLVAFGSAIEQTYGVATFLLLYIGSIFGGSLLSLAIHRHHDYSAVGASGGTCGLMFAFIFLFPGAWVSLFVLPIMVPGWIYAPLFLLYSFSGMHRGRDNIGHDAHLGGALIGLAIATALHPTIVFYSPWLYGSVVLLTTIFFVFLARNPYSSLRTLFAGGVRGHRPNLRYQRYDEGFVRIAVKNRVNQLLDKVAKGGIQRLTPSERSELERLSKELR